VKKKGAKLIIVLSHQGLDADKDLAGTVSGIDIIVGGHSHTAVTAPVRVGRTIITQAGSYGVYLGVLKLEVDPSNHRVASYTQANELKTLFSENGSPYDAKVAEIVSNYEVQISAEFERVVGETAVDLVRRNDGESNLGDLICDAVKEASGAQIVLQHSGVIRGDLPSGKVVMGSVYTILPFDNVIVTMDLTGTQILRALEESAESKRSILQVSGMRVEYDSQKATGHKVVKAVIGDMPLNPDESYRVAINDFLAVGGDHYDVFKEGTNVVYGDGLREALGSYLQKHSPVSPQTEARIAVR